MFMSHVALLTSIPKKNGFEVHFLIPEALLGRGEERRVPTLLQMLATSPAPTQEPVVWIAPIYHSSVIHDRVPALPLPVCTCAVVCSSLCM